MNRNDVSETLTHPISQRLLASSIPARPAYAGTDDAPADPVRICQVPLPKFTPRRMIGLQV